MNQDDYILKLIETGESLLEIKSSHRLAQQICFDQADDMQESGKAAGSLVQEKGLYIEYRILFGQKLADFLKLIEIDYGLICSDNVNGFKEIMDFYKQCAMTIANQSGIVISKFVIFNCLYHSLKMTEFAVKNNPSPSVSTIN